MAKRRIRRSDDRAPEEQSVEERRADRKKGKKSASGRKGFGSPLRRAAIIGIPVGIIAAIVVVLVFFNPFLTPCIQFSPIPTSSGVPAFPPHNTTDFTNTWCPPVTSLVLHVHPLVKIFIDGTSVTIPSPSSPPGDSLGRNNSYPGGYECDLPIHTHPPAAAAGFPAGVIHLESPWAYIYTLSNFFGIWSQSYSSAFVNSTDSSQPIIYQQNDLLGFTTDAGHSIELLVNNQPSSDGPNLELNTLDYSPNPFPACLGERYGTGNVIVLAYGPTGAIVTTHPAGTLQTGPAAPGLLEHLVGWPGPHPSWWNAHMAPIDHARAASLGWLALRVH